jgi:integrase
MGPDELVAYQKAATGDHRYDLLDLVQKYVLGFTASKNYKQRVYSSIRSFFMHNRAELPVDRSFHLRGDKPKTQGQLTVEDLRKVVLSLDPCHRAVFLCMFASGMGEEELVYWSNNGWESLREQLKDDAGIIRVSLPGRKRSRNERNFYTFVGGDALESLRKWLESRPRDAEAIFINQRGRPVTKGGLYMIWLRHMRRLNLVGPARSRDTGNRTGRHIHELRDLFRSQWAKSPASGDVAEFMMGHQVDSLGYNKSWRDVEFFEAEYRKALPWLNIMSSGRPFHQVSEEEVESLRAEVERLRAGRDAQIEELRRGLEELRKMIIDLMKPSP